MDVVEAVKARRSVRAFKPDPVPMDVLNGLMEQALRGPSPGSSPSSPASRSSR